MRFHFGVSFRLKTLKKFLFPILIGIATYFGLNFLNLGFIQVNALANYDTNFYIYYEELPCLNDNIDNNMTIRQFLDYVGSLNSEVNNLIVALSFYRDSNQYKVANIRLWSMPKSVASYPIRIYYSSSSDLKFRPSGSSSARFYTFELGTNTYTDILATTNYQNFLTCFNTGTCTSSGGNTIDNAFNFSNCSPQYITNDINVTCVTPKATTSYSTGNTNYIFYSSQVPLYLSLLDSESSTATNEWYKTTYFNNIKFENGDYVPLYIDYLNGELDPVIPEPEPGDDTTTHKSLFNKIYWLDDSNTEKGILTSIYEVLFLYCLTMIVFKLLTYLHNKRW